MVPDVLQVACLSAPDGTSQSSWGSPPVIGVFLSLPPAKNPICRVSGDQNGSIAPSVPAKRSNLSESSRRSHKYWFGPAPAVTAKILPSGEMAGDESAGGEFSNGSSTGIGIASRTRGDPVDAGGEIVF